jgi:outer membrane lipoprotein-sorting protein
VRLWSRCLIAPLCAALAVLPPAARADALSDVFARIDKAAASFRGFKADIRKVSHLDAINEDTVDNGTITVRRAKAQELDMLVNLKEPDPKLVSLSGKRVEIYYPKSNYVDEYDLNREYKSMAQKFLLLGFGTTSAELKSAYDVSLAGPETIAGQKATSIILIPKDKELAQHYPKFQLWISNETGIAVQQKVFETGGDYELATYTNMKLMNVPESDVKLQIPRDAVKKRPGHDN